MKTPSDPLEEILSYKHTRLFDKKPEKRLRTKVVSSLQPQAPPVQAAPPIIEKKEVQPKPPVVKKEVPKPPVQKAAPRGLPKKKPANFDHLNSLVQNLDPSLEIFGSESHLETKSIATILDNTPMEEKLITALKDRFLIEVHTYQKVEEIQKADLILVSHGKASSIEMTSQEGYTQGSFNGMTIIELLDKSAYENKEYKKHLWKSLIKQLQ